jgi:hypothetical protein
VLAALDRSLERAQAAATETKIDAGAALWW